jgi:hypothetical protein
MKKFIFTILTLCGIWAGTQSTQMNSAAAQTGNVITTPIPLTNQLAFTNTLVPPTTAASLQLSDVLNLLLTLQTNIERTLPALDLVQSNAAVVTVIPSNHVVGFFTPMTSNPAHPLLTPTGAASGTSRQRQTSLSITVGTNTLSIDAATLQAIFVLRSELQRTLPVLQALNGTTPASTNSALGTNTFVNPGITNFSPGPLTNRPTGPMTNSRAPFVNSNLPVPF